MRRHRGDTEAWTRLGELLRARRTQLGYGGGRRQRFVHERCRPAAGDGLSYKFVYELEGGPRWGRSGFPAGRLITASDAYAVTLESIAAALDGGNLEAAPAAGRPAPVPDLPAPGPPPAVLMSGVLSPQAIAAAAPYATRILGRLRDLAAEPVGVMQPSGYDVFQRDLAAEGIRDVFPGDRDAARQAASRWDRNADDMPEDDLVWLIAARYAAETASAQPDRNVG